MEVEIVRKILNANDEVAEKNRQTFKEKKVFVLNVMSSPGSGKTTILVRTLPLINKKIKCAVIVGDICTTNDADRYAETGIPVMQINTDQFGGDCHIAAHLITNAASSFDLDETDLLIIENIGNLVCPAEFDMGEDAKAVVISLTEGEDKPLKYPLMFRESDIALLNKKDLLPYLDCDMNEYIKNILKIHPGIPVLNISARTGEGFTPWIEWLEKKVMDKIHQGQDKDDKN